MKNKQPVIEIELFSDDLSDMIHSIPIETVSLLNSNFGGTIIITTEFSNNIERYKALLRWQQIFEDLFQISIIPSASEQITLELLETGIYISINPHNSIKYRAKTLNNLIVECVYVDRNDLSTFEALKQRKDMCEYTNQVPSYTLGSYLDAPYLASSEFSRFQCVDIDI